MGLLFNAGFVWLTDTPCSVDPMERFLRQLDTRPELRSNPSAARAAFADYNREQNDINQRARAAEAAEHAEFAAKQLSGKL